LDNLLCEIVKSIVDNPDEVNVDINESEDLKFYKLNVAEGDLGKVIGKRGQNVNALKTLLNAVTAKEGNKRAILEIIE
jgi:hypothetical protein